MKGRPLVQRHLALDDLELVSALIVAAFAVFLAVGFALDGLSPDPMKRLFLAATLGHVAAVAWSWDEFRKGRLEQGLRVLLASSLLVFFAGAFDARGGAVTAVVPVINVALALPYLSAQSFRAYAALNWLALLVNSLASASRANDGIWMGQRGDLPSDLAGVLATGVTCLLFWQIKRRLAFAGGEAAEAGREWEEMEERSRRIVEGAGEGIWILGLDGETLLANRRAAAFFLPAGSAPDPRLEQDALPRAWKDRIAESLRLAAEGRSLEEEVFLIQPGGRGQWIQFIARPYLDEAGEAVGALLTLSDISALKRARARVSKALSSEAEGRLAGGVAHDFNNVLTVVTGSAGLLEETLEKGGLAARSLARLSDAAGQARALVRQLLAFSRREAGESGSCDPAALLRDLEPMLRRAMGSHWHLGLDLPEGGLWIGAQSGPLEQVLLQAGLACREESSQGTLLVELAAMGEGALIWMSAVDARGEELRRFHRAPALRAALDSLEAQGATWSRDGAGLLLRLPPASDKAPMRVLFVDDDEDLRQVALRGLRREGWQVEEADGLQSAVEAWKNAQGRFDALVTDVIMPGGSGPSLAEALRALQPGLRVLFVSGYASHGSHMASGGDQSEAFLGKPFTPEQLSRSLKVLLRTPT